MTTRSAAAMSSPHGPPPSQEKTTAAYWPDAVSRAVRARRAVVLPVCLGAWTTK
jgi:hypothetical protein